MTQDPENRITRRTALKGAAASAVGLVAGSSFAGQTLMQAGAPQEAVLGSNDKWFAQRA